MLEVNLLSFTMTTSWGMLPASFLAIAGNLLLCSDMVRMLDYSQKTPNTHHHHGLQELCVGDVSGQDGGVVVVRGRGDVVILLLLLPELEPGLHPRLALAAGGGAGQQPRPRPRQPQPPRARTRASWAGRHVTRYNPPTIYGLQLQTKIRDDLIITEKVPTSFEALLRTEGLTYAAGLVVAEAARVAAPV